MQSTEIKRILKKYSHVFEALERYDNTHELSTDRVRVDVTLARRTVEKLRRKKKQTGKPISQLIEEAL